MYETSNKWDPSIFQKTLLLDAQIQKLEDMGNVHFVIEMKLLKCLK